MFKIRKDDTVVVLKGKDRGKSGKVLRVLPSSMKAVVQGVGIVKKHLKKRKQDEPGGIMEKESPISMNNIALFCNKCNKQARVGFKIETSEKVRYCKRCKGVFV
jgi:large subunit ribosomal protein L24